MTTLFNDLPEQRRPLKELPPGVIEPNWTPPELIDIKLEGVKRLAVDVETKDPELSEKGPGCRREGNYVCGLAIGTDDGRRWYLPTRHEGGNNLDEKQVWRWAQEKLNAFDGELVGAHMIYDLDWLANYNVTFPNVTSFLDVQNAEPLIDENRYQFGLEVLANDYLGKTKETEELRQARKVWKFKTEKALKQNLWRMPAHVVGPYAEGDVDLPLRILPKQLKKLEEEDLLTVWDVECRLIPMLLSMRRRGVRVDVEGAAALREALVEKRNRILVAIRRIAGPSAELTLPQTLGPALEAAGIPVPRTAKTGAYSITKELLALYAHVPLAELIREGRKLNTIIGTFIDGHVFGHAINGRLHCEFNQLKRDEGGTIARFSSSNPNLQNIPARDEELAPMVRGLFLPEPGERWEQQDLSQIEYRFLVHYARGSGAEKARQRYAEDPGLSFHVMAGEMFGLSDLRGEPYKRIKNTNFCKVYGGGVPKLAATFNCPLEEAQEFNDRYDAELPFVSHTFREAEALATRRGYVKTILKRRRRFPFWEPPRRDYNSGTPLREAEARERWGNRIKRVGTRNSLNGMLQGGAADYMKKSMVDMWDAGICDVVGPPLLTVHDELDWSRAETKAALEAMAEAKRCFETAIPLRVPVFAESKSGSNWGEVE